MRVEFKGEGTTGTLLVDGVRIDSATMFTLVARAGEWPIAIIESFVDMPSPVVMDAGRIVWIVRALGALPADAKLEVTQNVQSPDEWTVRRVHASTPVTEPTP